MAGLLDAIESSGIAETVSKVAPLLATVLGGPLAGVGVSLLASLFHVDPKNVAALTSAITSDPEASIKIKTLEYEHVEMLSKIASTDYTTEVQDRMDARKYATTYKDFMRHFAYLITLGFFVALFGLFIPINITADEKNLLSMMVGVLGSKWQTIVDFYFGSSNRNNQGAMKK